MTLREYLRQQLGEDLAVGLVLTLAFLVLDDAALFVELGLGDGAGEMAHAV